jgi:ABC-type branched-subunit amino acid transport system substrate-binding protein
VKLRQIFAVTVISVITLAACSSTSQKTAAPAGPTSTTPAGGGEWAKIAALGPATGQPITVGTVSQDSGAAIQTGAADSLAAYAAYIDQHGGIGGHPLKVDRCDDKGDAQAHAACIRGFIDDPSVVGVVDAFARNMSTVGLPLLVAANMPVVNPFPLRAAEFSSPNSLDVTGGNAVILPLLVKYYASQSKTKMAYVGIDSSAVNQTRDQLASLVKAAGGTYSPVSYPLGTIDFLPTATALAATKADVILAAGVPVNDVAGLLKALQGVGNTSTIAFVPGSLTGDSLKAAGSTANGVVSVRFFPDPQTAEDHAMFSAYQTAIKARGSTVSDTTLGGWMSGEILRRLVFSVGADNPTRATLLHAVQTDDIQGIPLMPATVGRSQSPDPATLGAVGAPGAYLAVVKNGQLTILDPKYVNPFQK